MAQWRSLMISSEYNFFERSKRILEDFEAVISNTDFGTEVAIEALVREDRADEFAAKLIDASNGKALCEEVGSRFMGVRIR